MDIDVDIGDRLVAVPARYLLNHQLQLIEQLWIHRGITWPDANLVVIQKSTDVKVLGDRQIYIGGTNLEKSFGRWGLAAHALCEIRPDSIAT